MKMSDVFDLPVSSKSVATKVNPPARLMDAVAHAVNCHDDLLAALESAPIPSAYHGMHGFEADRFLADYAEFQTKRRAALAKARGEA